MAQGGRLGRILQVYLELLQSNTSSILGNTSKYLGLWREARGGAGPGGDWGEYFKYTWKYFKVILQVYLEILQSNT